MGASAPLKKKMVCNFFVNCHVKCPLPCSVFVHFHEKCSHCVVLSFRTLWCHVSVLSHVKFLYSRVRCPYSVVIAACLLSLCVGTLSWLGRWWHSWLRHCATSQKMADSIPYGVNGIFHWHKTSGRTTAQGLTQPLTEMRTRNIFRGLGRLVRTADYLVLKSGSLNLL